MPIVKSRLLITKIESKLTEASKAELMQAGGGVFDPALLLARCRGGFGWTGIKYESKHACLQLQVVVGMLGRVGLGRRRGTRVEMPHGIFSTLACPPIHPRKTKGVIDHERME